MIKKILLEKTIQNNCLVKYYLCEEKSSSQNKILFGIAIELYSEDRELKTCESISRITESQEIVLNMINLMAKKNVTPNSLFYVVDEIYDIASKS